MFKKWDYFSKYITTFLFIDLDFDVSKKEYYFYRDDLAVITFKISFTMGLQNVLPICRPKLDYDYKNHVTQYTIIGKYTSGQRGLHKCSIME